MTILILRTAILALCLFALFAASLIAGSRDELNRLAPNEAKEIVRLHLKLPKERGLPLKELTTDAVWTKLKTQVFRVEWSDALPTNAAFAIKDRKAIPIGQDFGGQGVNSICAAELNGKPHLVFSYSWGSGIHRSQVGALDPFAKEPTAIAAAQSLVLDFVHDWNVRAIDEKTVRVEGGGVSFGDLELTEKDGVRKLNIRLPADLPEAVKKNIKSSE